MDCQEWGLGGIPGSGVLTQANATVLQQVAQVVEHGTLVLPADATEVTEEAAAARDHLGEADLLGQAGWANGQCLSSVAPAPELLAHSAPLPWTRRPRGHSP